MGVVVPRVLNDGWEGRVVEPHGFKVEGFRTKRLRGEGSAKEKRVMVRGSPRQVHNLSIVEKQVPLKV